MWNEVRQRKVFLEGLMIALAGPVVAAVWMLRPAGPLVALRVLEVEAIQEPGDMGPDHWRVTLEMSNLSSEGLHVRARQSNVMANLGDRWVKVRSEGLNGQYYFYTIQECFMVVPNSLLIYPIAPQYVVVRSKQHPNILKRCP